MSGQAFLDVLLGELQATRISLRDMRPPRDKTPMQQVYERLDRIERLLGMDVPDAELQADRDPDLRVRTILRAVCWHMGAKQKDVIGRGRTLTQIRPRAAVCWLARALTRHSTTQIGIVLGGRDHSTVIALLARAEKLRRDDPAFRRVTDRILKRFNEEKEFPHD